jgi:hypothetical protein
MGTRRYRDNLGEDVLDQSQGMGRWSAVSDFENSSPHEFYFKSRRSSMEIVSYPSWVPRVLARGRQDGDWFKLWIISLASRIGQSVLFEIDRKRTLPTGTPSLTFFFCACAERSCITLFPGLPVLPSSCVSALLSLRRSIPPHS